MNGDLRDERKLAAAPAGTHENDELISSALPYDAILSALPKDADPVDHYPYSMLRDVTDPVVDSDTAFFWHVPKSAGSNLKRVFFRCLKLTLASQTGRVLCRKQNKLWDPSTPAELRVCSNQNGRFVNVDVSKGLGIGQAKTLGLVPSRLADVIVSMEFRPASALFAPDFRGRAFVFFRHPVERVVSTFYYLAQADWEDQFNPALADMTIMDFARSKNCPKDWLVRNLLGLKKGTHASNGHLARPLTSNDMATAKELVRRKILVLMVNDFESSLLRLSKYFGWGDSRPDEKYCLNESIGTKENGVVYDRVKEGSEAWNLIAEKNRGDMELYEYAYSIYTEQGKTLFSDIHS